MYLRLGAGTLLVTIISSIFSSIASGATPTPSPSPTNGFCCYWAPSSDKCGTCTAFDVLPSWCAQSATNCISNCGGTWCPQSLSTTKPTTAKSATTSTTTTATSGVCCHWAPSSDTCGTCTAFDAPPAWCAESATNCIVNCAGTWCPQTQITTRATTTRQATTKATTTTSRTATSSTAKITSTVAQQTTTAATTKPTTFSATTPVQKVTTTTFKTTTILPKTTTAVQRATTTIGTTTTPTVTTTSKTGFCCYWAPTADKCGTCTAFDKPPAWCAQSATNCQINCAGTWCQQIPITTSGPTTTATTVRTILAGSLTPTATPSKSPTPSPSPSANPTGGNWVEGTYVTGYWDCCKPSCSWPNKGNVNAPVRSCRPDGTTADPNDPSVCNSGGIAASCSNNQPWMYNSTTSLGFTAAAVSGTSGLTGDGNCGQCFQMVFTSGIHQDGNWGGAYPDLVGKSHIVQVTNIGYDVTGTHSFDLQIPGAGQGIFTTGCAAQFGGQSSNYDCGNNYGGCNDISGCARLPVVLQPGCRWRFTWFDWLLANGRTNNPYVRFRRVRCPTQLTSISGTVPLDDGSYPTVIV